MRTRLTLATVAAAVLLLTLAAPAMALRRADTGVPYGWLLQLRGRRGSEDIGLADLRPTSRLAEAARRQGRPWTDDNKTPDDAADDLTSTWASACGVSSAASTTPTRARSTPDARHHGARLQRGRSSGVDGFSGDLHERRARGPLERRARASPTAWTARRSYLGTASIKTDPVLGPYATWKAVVAGQAGQPATLNVPGSRKPSASAERISIVPVEAAGVDGRGCGRVPYGWLLQLRGPRGSEDMASRTFDLHRAWQKQPGVKVDRGPTTTRRRTTPPTTYIYVGVGLWRLVGRIDDADPGDVRHQTLATTAPGYSVVGRAAWTASAATFTSAELVARSSDALVRRRPPERQGAVPRHRVDQERRRQLEAHVAAQAHHQRRQRVQQPQGRQRGAHQHRAGRGGRPL